MSKPMIAPGASVTRNIMIYQLRNIVKLAEDGYYGANSAAVLARSLKQLVELGA